jgi:amino acid transporter
VNTAGLSQSAPARHLQRGITLRGAISANVLNMVGIGPFLTIPLVLADMGGPQAMLGWILGAAISLCDGLVWAELGSAMPRSGGPYYYLLEAFGPKRIGRLVSFLFLWQAMLIGPLSIASGAVGFSQYARYLWPSLHGSQLEWIAAAVCLANMLLLMRNIRSINGLSVLIAAIVLGTAAWIAFSGVLHFHPAMAFDFPAHSFNLSMGFFAGLGSATLVAVYDYGGYYNVCLVGEEVENPRRTIPRSILIAIAVVAVLYLLMNFSILGVIPWREAMHSKAIASLFMERLYGSIGGDIVTVLILIATFGSVFAVLLGYSRIPYAAACEGRFFSIFARLHPRGQYPIVAVVVMGVLSGLACVFSLSELITTLIVVQTLLQFMGQCVAVIVLHKRTRGNPECFRMPLFPLPALIALAGWSYIVLSSGVRYMLIALALLSLGIAGFLFHSRLTKEWPFKTT